MMSLRVAGLLGLASLLSVVAASSSLEADASQQPRSAAVRAPRASSAIAPLTRAERGATGRVPRTVLALYDGAQVPSSRFTLIHRTAEMPLNHLGLVVRYHDIQQGLPAVENLPDVRGVLTWFGGDSMRDPGRYLQWLQQVLASGRRVVMIHHLGFLDDPRGTPTPLAEINRTLGMIGLRFEPGLMTTTYGARYEVANRDVFGFERPLPVVVPPYARLRAAAPDAKVLLRVASEGRLSTTSDLAVVSPRGGWIADGFALFVDNEDDYRQWLVNPFEFFRQALGTDDLPKPDTTTLSGRRMFYSHIDGDGWRNVTLVEPYRTRHVISARVILEQVIRKFPDLPVTVGPIAGDLDPKWHGTPDSLAAARETFLEPQVEAGIHTYSHPLVWGSFAPGAERDKDREPEASARSYHVRPFSLTTEIDQAVAFVDGLLPRGRHVSLVQWSGDTLAFEEAIAHVRMRQLPNINGGDSRFDPDFPSASWVAAIGTGTGHERQIYSSNSNENTYTHNWRDRFFAFGYLPTTIRNTGSPRRLKPFNVYYHTFSGERLSSLNAVVANLTYARSLSLTPVEASRFSRIADGFYAAAFDRTGPRTWTVSDRGALQTIRFDRSQEGVDFSRSTGVIGQRHEQGSLYVALDETVPTAVVALKSIGAAESEPLEREAYLIDARWRVFELVRERRSIRYRTEGYGAGEFTWKWPFGTRAHVRWTSESGQAGDLDIDVDKTGQLIIRLPQMTRERVTVVVTAIEGASHVG